MNNRSDQNKNLQRWVNVVLCGFMIFTCLGFCSSNKSLYLTAITDALEMKRSAYSLAMSCRFVVTAIINVFLGMFIAKFGTKKLMVAGFAVLIGCMMLNSVATNVWTFCISEALSGIAFSWSGTAIVGVVINRCCTKNTGTIMGAVLAANGIGGALAAQIVTPIIYEDGNIFGYRNAYKLVAVILAVVGLLVLFFFKETPPDVHEDTKNVTKKKARGSSWVGIELKDAYKKVYFYGAAVCIFLTGLSLQSTGSISSAHFFDVGFDKVIVASVASVSSILLTCSKFVTGFLYDKLGLRGAISICNLAASVSLFLLAIVENNDSGTAIIYTYSILHAIALPLETVMLPLYAKDLFGEKAYAKMVGLFIAINVLGYATGGPIVNFAYERVGTYKPILLVITAVMVAVFISLQFVITAAHKTRRQVEALLNDSKMQKQETNA